MRKVGDYNLFRRSHRVERQVTTEVSEQEKVEVAKIIAWRQSYDIERSQALKDGTGCGRCIGGVVKFGFKETDVTPCNCGREKQGDQE